MWSRWVSVKEKRCTQRNLRTQSAYESRLAFNLLRSLIQGNPPRARSRLSPVDDPAWTVKNVLTAPARPHEFGVTIGHLLRARVLSDSSQFRFRSAMLAAPSLTLRLE